MTCSVATGGRTLAVGAREERDFLDWTLSKALKHCTISTKIQPSTEALRSIPEIHRNLAECLEPFDLSRKCKYASCHGELGAFKRRINLSPCISELLAVISSITVFGPDF
jgi:hypothetical protein